MARTRILSVMANPYHHLDHEGRPAAAVPRCPDFTGQMLDTPAIVTHRIGARLQADVVKAANARLGTDAEHDHYFEFTPEAERVDATHPEAMKYYKERVRHGEILCADLESWVLMGFDPKEFEDPAKLIAAEKTKAVADWSARHGYAPKATVEHWAELMPPPAPPKKADPPKTQTPAPAMAPAKE